MQKPLSGKAALVTGAARRIGRAIALVFAEAGADVAITFRDSEADAQATIQDLIQYGVRTLATPCDVADPESVERSVSRVHTAFGRLDLLVNNAGSFASIPLEGITPEAWDAIFATNTRGPFLMARAAHTYLKKTHGRIINIGSLGGMEPWATHGHYCTSKAALHMLSQVMAKAWAPEISVNCVAPGMIVQGEVDTIYQHFADRTPMKRNGTAADVAAAVLFFATGPHFITGQLLAVDGGLGL